MLLRLFYGRLMRYCVRGVKALKTAIIHTPTQVGCFHANMRTLLELGYAVACYEKRNFGGNHARTADALHHAIGQLLPAIQPSSRRRCRLRAAATTRSPKFVGRPTTRSWTRKR